MTAVRMAVRKAGETGVETAVVMAVETAVEIAVIAVRMAQMRQAALGRSFWLKVQDFS